MPLDRPEVREKQVGDLAHVMHGYVGDASDGRLARDVPDDLTEFEDVAPLKFER